VHALAARVPPVRESPVSAEDPQAILVPEIRDYALVNAEIRRRLDAGARLVRLAGVAGQRFLAHDLRGPWQARIEIAGDPGPECASRLDAPGLTVHIDGNSADGLGAELAAGMVWATGHAGDAVGYRQRGGILVICREVGHRAGLEQQAGILAVLGSPGRLPGDRASGGILITPKPEGGWRMSGLSALDSRQIELVRRLGALELPYTLQAELVKRLATSTSKQVAESES
jgi:glutamate synthase domain-containing protein 3